jgi:hypothetical protein
VSLEDARLQGKYPPDRMESVSKTSTQATKESFDWFEACLSFIDKVFKVSLILVFRLAIAGFTAYLAMWAYPEGFLGTAFAALTPGDLLLFALSVVLWFLAFVFLVR